MKNPYKALKQNEGEIIMNCKLRNSEFDETQNKNECPACGERYYLISMYQNLVEKIQSKQYEIEYLCEKINNEQLSGNKFRNTLLREEGIYNSFNSWLESILNAFQIPKKKDYWSDPYYETPTECQMQRGKICNSCMDC